MDETQSESVSEAVENAQQYETQLQESLKSLNVAKTQIEESAKKTIGEITEVFSSIKTVIENSIQHRKQQLIKDVLDIQKKALHPLDDCHDLITDHMFLTKEFLEEGNKVLNNFPNVNKETLLMFNNKSSILGSLPEVPLLTHVPSISISFNPSVPSQISSFIATYGKISRISPVQITECYQRPGALLLRWEEIESESEATEFRLQMSVTTAAESALTFTDAYCGSDNSFIARDLNLHTNYTFRVSCRNEAEESWCAWSLPFIAKTAIVPYEWDSKNENYLLTKDNKIATKVTSNPSLLHSSSAQYCCGHSLLFQIIECCSAHVDEGIGLMTAVNKPDATMLLRAGVFFINSQGIIFVDGREMTTRLPPFHNGSKLVFESEALPNHKTRIIVECDGKTVAYDWKTHLSELYFIQFFRKDGWKILVE